jgi:hypothetical protein
MLDGFNSISPSFVKISYPAYIIFNKEKKSGGGD